MPLTGVLASIVHPQLAEALTALEATALGSSAEFGQSITIRRLDTTLAAQSVRLTVPSGAGMVQSAAAEQGEASVMVVGRTDLDIAKGDRFNHDGTLYQVDFVRPGRQVHTVAYARAVQ